MNAVRTELWLAVGFVAILLLTGCTRVHQVPHTERIRQTADFGFTVSPDNRWIVFFEENPRDTDPELHRNYGLLCVLDYGNATLHRFHLKMDQAPGVIRLSSAAWSEDSAYCILPSPPNRARAVLIDLRDEPEVAAHPGVINRRNDEFFFSDGVQEMQIPEQLTCSDCPDVKDFRSFVQAHLPRGHQLGSSSERGTAISVDGRYVFYVRGSHTERMSIVRRDVQTSEDHDVTAHTSRAIMKSLVIASDLRPSPDGRWLAYRLTYSDGNWGDRGRLVLLDLNTGQRREIAPEVFYQMHWTSDSSRLYFYRSERGLQYVQVKRAG